MAFREDDSRLRKDYAPENLSLLTWNLLNQGTTAKAGFKAKRVRVGWDHNYLLGLLYSPYS